MKKPNFKNFIQVAGVANQQEADMLIQCGINYLGFPMRLPVNKEDLSEEEAGLIIKHLTPPNYGVVISYSQTANDAIELCHKMNTNIIQLHGPITINELESIRILEPNLLIIKSLVITNNNESQLTKTLKDLEPFVDAFITDTFDPSTCASGATGKTHDWNISRRFVELSLKPVILAGGLNVDNVYNSILKVKPAGVDVHTGVENSRGRKDKQLVQNFITEANKAFNQI
jgi:phosphoribosylanthranilate isomerase